ncbi:hypothetical protein FZEAL_8428 [Fusarium zealandicum]|uniref:Uncharacterized protein n=1 Tax=Fusarium zealandicum TaxID=1053134 RepID=A0A8H4XHN7_9HYPO|nr:hypothetical protein FZEAL_8428 [Fusarium zealandicum]
MGVLNDFPRPTAPPTLAQLHRRTESSGAGLITISVAPDNICGYISERPGAQHACSAQERCLLVPPLPASYSIENGGILCCDENSKCDDGCAVDNFILKCVDETARYCNTVSYSGNILDYWCNSIDISTAQRAETTYKGQDARDFATIDEDEYSSIQSMVSQAQTAGNGIGTASRTSSPEATETNTDDDSGGSPPTGAIVGGVVGGVGAIALLFLAVLFFLRRKKKQNEAATPDNPATGASAASPGMSETKGAWPSPGQQQPGMAYYYDPNNPNTPATYQTISPNSAYNQQQYAGYQPIIAEADGETVKAQPQELGNTEVEKKQKPGPTELA